MDKIGASEKPVTVQGSFELYRALQLLGALFGVFNITRHTGRAEIYDRSTYKRYVYEYDLRIKRVG